MQKADLKDVVSIENRAYPYPWSKGIFADCLRVGYHCRVMDISGFIGSYGIMSVAAQESHILNLCVRPEWRGHGLARRMLEHLLERAHSAGSQTMFLEVRPSNQQAIRLYQSSGFCEVGVRPAYYPGRSGREDALVMAKTLAT